MPCIVPVTLFIFFSSSSSVFFPSSSLSPIDLSVSCHLDFYFKLRFLCWSCASRSCFAPSLYINPHVIDHLRAHIFPHFRVWTCSGCSLYMRDAVCAQVASCGRSLQLMCPNVVMWIPNNTLVSAPHAYVVVQNTVVQWHHFADALSSGDNDDRISEQSTKCHIGHQKILVWITGEHPADGSRETTEAFVVTRAANRAAQQISALISHGFDLPLAEPFRVSTPIKFSAVVKRPKDSLARSWRRNTSRAVERSACAARSNVIVDLLAATT